MKINKPLKPCEVNVSSEFGRLRAVMLHRPGVEIERMTPLNANHALYSDILDKKIVDTEYSRFCGVLERWTNVYYVEDILEELLKDEEIKRHLVNESVFHFGMRPIKQAGNSDYQFVDRLIEMDNVELAKVLIEGYENPKWDGKSDDRYLLEPLYNLFFTRDASSTLYNRVLLNSMSFDVREREPLIYDTIFRHFFKVDTLNAMQWNSNARTEGGDVHIAAPDLLCIGEGIRTNAKGIEYLAQQFAKEREHFNILVQELPHEPESFIHLDMVFTFLGKHQCMAFEPMLKKEGIFAGKETTLISINHGKISYCPMDNIVKGLNSLGWDIDPVIGGGSDAWTQMREQWHSGCNFFSMGDGKVIGYKRNTHTIEALDKAGFAVLDADDIVSGKVDMNNYEKFVATFAASELPRGGGGARCMTMPILRD